MTRERTWSARIRDVGEAFLGVLRAEVAEIATEIGRSGRALVRALVLVAVAAGISFWTVGLVLYFAIELLALVLPRWGAVGIVLGVFLLVSLVLLLLARSRFAAVESPAETVRRRFDDHRQWWQGRIASRDGEDEGDLESRE